MRNGDRVKPVEERGAQTHVAGAAPLSPGQMLQGFFATCLAAAWLLGIGLMFAGVRGVGLWLAWGWLAVPRGAPVMPYSACVVAALAGYLTLRPPGPTPTTTKLHLVLTELGSAVSLIAIAWMLR